MKENSVSGWVMNVTQPLIESFYSNQKWINQTDTGKIKKRATWNCLWVALILLKVLTPVESLDHYEKRPIWNIGHMVNAIAQVDYYLNEGANGLEFDIEFDSQGRALYTHHGVPCDCFRDCIRWEYVDTYLDYMRQLTTPGNRKFRNNLVLLYLDLKVKYLSPSALKYAAKDLASKLINFYWKRGTSGARAYLLVALPSLQQIEFVGAFQQALGGYGTFLREDKIGYIFLGNDAVDDVNYVLYKTQVSNHVWQADGTTNCLARSYWRLQQLLDKRNDNNNHYFNKVFWWTVDNTNTMKDILSLGIDAIVTNYPGHLTWVLKDKLFSKYVRLADINDSPWQRHPGKGKIPYVAPRWGCTAQN